MNKIELITQPNPEQDKISHSESLDHTIEKLKHLVEDNPPVEEDEQEAADIKQLETDRNSASSPTRNEAHSKLKDYNDKHEEQTEYDDDGFEIPQGKIPLDGHFSTREIKEIVDLAQKEGLLNVDVDIKVLEHSDQLGDKVVIADHSVEEKKQKKDDKEKEKEDSKEETKENTKEE